MYAIRSYYETYRELNDYTDENGNKLSENTKQATAAVCGLIAAGTDVTELLGIKKALLDGLVKSGNETLGKRLLAMLV